MRSILAAFAISLALSAAGAERQILNRGSFANDATGDTPWVYLNKANQNFLELFSRSGSSGISNANAIGGLALSHALTNSAAWRAAAAVNAPIRPQWYGATGDGAADDTAELQAMIDAAQASSSLSILIPEGTYKITAPLTLAHSKPIAIRGTGWRGARIVAGAAMTNMITIGSSAAQSTRYEIHDIELDGASLAEKGIYSSRLDHMLLYRVRVTGTTSKAIDIGYGWCNDIVECDVSNNSGDGINLNTDQDFGGNNAGNILNSKIFLNSGFGITVRSGYGYNIRGCTIEDNRKAGIFASFGVFGLGIVGNYFEKNAQTGFTFTNSSELVKSDIVLNGMTALLASGFAFPCRSVSIVGNYVSADYSDAFVYAAAGEDIAIELNSADDGDTASVLRVPLDKDYANPVRISLRNNNNFTGAFLPTQEIADTSVDASTWRLDGARPQNYASDDNWRWIVEDSTGTVSQNAPTYQGFKTLVVSDTDDDSRVGIVLDLDVHTELRGKLAYVGAWIKHGSSNAMNVAAYISNRGLSRNFNTQTTEWLWVENQAVLEESGTMLLGFARQAGDPGDVFYVSKPVIALVGVDPDSFYPRVEGEFVRDENGYRRVGTWESQSSTNNALALVTLDVDRWLIGTNGNLTANGNNNLTTSGNITGAILASTSYMQLPNNTALYGRNVADDAAIAIAMVDSADQVAIATGGATTTIGGALKMGNTPGLTTNINVIISGGTTNQLQFTHGVLTGVVPQ